MSASISISAAGRGTGAIDIDVAAHQILDEDRLEETITTAGQRDVKFKYVVLSVKGSTGIAHWSAQFGVPDGPTIIKLDGVFLLEFDSGGKCRSLREWWHLQSTPPAS